jgi:probable rRNA maturation factor
VIEMPRDDRRLDVYVSDARGRPASAPGLGAWLRRVAPARTRGVVSVALVSDVRVRALNRTYRRQDYPTDVLSFPASSDPQPLTPNPFPFLGDIVIARGVARRQARAAGHAEGTELRILALHGLLHLLGYDHEQDDGAMLRLERRLRRDGGLREGLIERARSPSTGSGRAASRPATGGGGSRRARGEPVERRARR